MNARRDSIGRLGPFPQVSIRVMVDLGLTDTLIARYFAIDSSQVVLLRDSGAANPSTAEDCLPQSTSLRPENLRQERQKQGAQDNPDE